MKAVLIKSDGYRFVTEDPPVKPEDLADWKIGDQKAMSDIILSIQPSELKQIKNCETSKQIWARLSEIYKSTGPARKATLLKSLLQLKMRDDESDVRDHLNAFFNLVDQLNDLQIDIDDDLLTIMLLYSLPGEFDNFRVAIESRDELPKPESLRIKIVEEFNARRIGSQSTISGAYFAATGRRRNFRRPKLKRSKYGTSDRVCWNCNKPGHFRNKCPSVPHSRLKQSSTFIAECDSVHRSSAKTSGLFVLDSGSSGHFLSKEKFFTELKKTPTRNLNLADDSCTEIHGTGDAAIITKMNGQEEEILVQEAMFVPKLRNNLLSIAKICDKGYTAIFDKKKVKLKNKFGDVIVGKRKENLYCLEVFETGKESMKSSFANQEKELEPRESTAIASSSLDTQSKGSFLKWHYRFGHASAEELMRGIKADTFKDLKELPPIPKEFDCEVCIKGKLCQSSFPNTHVKSNEKLEIVHTDLCGPIRTRSFGGASYFITFIDESSDWTEVRFLKNKSDAFEVFREVKNLLERQSGRKIKFVQSDRGTEYLGNRFNSLLKELGIARRLTVKHTPQQNGRAERKNRTLLDIARCMLIQSGLPVGFWAEAIATANHIKNRTPSKTLGGKTPYSLWFGRNPNVGYFKTFGCEAYVWNNSKTKKKFEPRGLKGIFMGYDEQSKGFRVYLSDQSKIEITRSVKFLENTHHVPNQEIDLDPYREDVIKSDKDTQTWIFPLPNNTVNSPEKVEDLPKETKTKRGPGRPRKEKSGKPGRPKKVYRTVSIPESSDNLSDSSSDTDLDDSNSDIDPVCDSIEKCMIAIDEIPLEEAINSKDSESWIKAIATEIKSIIKNDTFDLIDSPVDIDSNANLIGSRFILRNKTDSSGSKLIKKARLIAQGFGQVPNVNYFQNQTYSPVTRLSSVRLLVTLASKLNLKIHQFDITTAYLNGILDETVIMKIPKYFDVGLKYIIKNEPDIVLCSKAKEMLDNLEKSDKVCLLKKSLYGLKQSGRCWFLKLKEILLNFGFENTISDPCVFHMKVNGLFTMLTVYVDDFLIISEDPVIISKLYDHLEKELEVKYSGEASICLGIEFEQSNGAIVLSQSKYISDLLEKYGMSNCNTVNTPMEVGLKLIKAVKCEESLPYRELIGSLNYLAVCTRPDISYSVSYLSQFLSCYDNSHWTAAKRILRYLKKTINFKLNFKFDNSDVKGFTDSDWGNNIEDRRSFSGFVFLIGNSAVSWEAKKQKTVALSSTEAEYMSLSDGCKEALYLQKLMGELNLLDISNIKIFVDNNGALKLSESTSYHSRSKHIDIKHHFIREVLRDNDCINLEKISTSEMCADVLTKALPASKHYKCLDMINLKEVI